MLSTKHPGKHLTDNFASYRIPSIRDIPEMDIILVEDPAPNGPYGAKGVGETRACQRRAVDC